MFMKKEFCIVTPLHKKSINEYEKNCLIRINDNFKVIDKFLITFEENNLDEVTSNLIKNYKRVNLSKSWFESIYTYNMLSCSIEFYDKFKNYKYILICHLDALVLSSNIQKFIDLNYSFIGAPTAKKSPFDRSRKKLWKLKYFCNGGFSLRKVDDFLSVLNSENIRFPFNKFTIKEIFKSGFFKFLILYIKTFFHKKNKKGLYFSNNLYVHEDTFWSYFATLFHDNFKLPDKEDCLKFAFDGNPDFYYKKNNFQLPLAFHGYHNYVKFLDKIKK